jgi:hypothetical protein
MTSLQCGSGFRAVRFGMLLIGLLLPGAAPAVVESVISFGSESEVACEDVAECITQADTHRPRKRRSCQSGWSRRRISCAERTIEPGSMLDGHGTSGHRNSNGLLAPMRC